jgi:hypothetical protein
MEVVAEVGRRRDEPKEIPFADVNAVAVTQAQSVVVAETQRVL